MAYLLDINVLIALSDPMHLHHEAAHQWFATTGRTAWATCPITENGFVRVASHPSYPNRPGDVSAVVAILRQLRASAGHHFWPDDVSLVEILTPDAILLHAQITDLYLLGLARQHGGQLATFDQRIPTSIVQGGGSALTIIPT